MSNYQNGLIYRICCRDINIKEQYVGSTIDFKDRKSKHKNTCNNPNEPNHNLKVYQFIRENGNWENWSMVLIQKYPCNDKLELRKRERYWIETLKSTLNCNIPTRTSKEWREDNIDDILKKRKENYNEIKDNEDFKQKGKEYRLATKEHKKLYDKQLVLNRTEEKKEEKKEYLQNYYQNNKNKWVSNTEKSRQPVECECGRIVKGQMARHKRSPIHLKLMSEKK